MPTPITRDEYIKRVKVWLKKSEPSDEEAEIIGKILWSNDREIIDKIIFTDKEFEFAYGEKNRGVHPYQNWSRPS